MFMVSHFSKYDVRPVMQLDSAPPVTPPVSALGSWFTSVGSMLGKVVDGARRFASGSTSANRLALDAAGDSSSKRTLAATQLKDSVQQGPAKRARIAAIARAVATPVPPAPVAAAGVAASGAAVPAPDLIAAAVAAATAAGAAAGAAAAVAACSEFQRRVDHGQQSSGLSTAAAASPAALAADALLKTKFSDMRSAVTFLSEFNTTYNKAPIVSTKNGNQTRKTFVCVRHPGYVNHIEKQRKHYETQRELAAKLRPAASQNEEPLRKRGRKAREPPEQLARCECDFKAFVKEVAGGPETGRYFQVCENSVLSHSCRTGAGDQRAPLKRKQIQDALIKLPGGKVRVEGLTVFVCHSLALLRVLACMMACVHIPVRACAPARLDLARTCSQAWWLPTQDKRSSAAIKAQAGELKLGVPAELSDHQAIRVRRFINASRRVTDRKLSRQLIPALAKVVLATPAFPLCFPHHSLLCFCSTARFS